MNPAKSIPPNIRISIPIIVVYLSFAKRFVSKSTHCKLHYLLCYELSENQCNESKKCNQNYWKCDEPEKTSKSKKNMEWHTVNVPVVNRPYKRISRDVLVIEFTAYCCKYQRCNIQSN